jgi:NADH-quinone oxidoreductase subunit N
MTGFDPTVFLSNLACLKPELFMTILGFVLMALAVAVPRELRWSIGIVAVVGLIVAAILVAAYFPAFPMGGPKMEPSVRAGAFTDAAGRPAFVADGFAMVFKLIFLIGGALCVLLAMRYLDHEGIQAGEFYAIVVFAILGMMFLASGNDFATIYIGLETMALSSYILVGFNKFNRRSNEAALKYFLMGAFASGVLLYGISLVYGTTGTFNLTGIAQSIERGSPEPMALLQIGAILILVGMGFKIAAVPFHMWAPDAYEGAPTPITGFISTAAKAAAFAMLLRVFLQGFYGLANDWMPLWVLLSVASMTIGNVAAVLQDNVKRMLAYSSIAHAGYMLMGLIAVGAAGEDYMTLRYGMTSVVLYLLVYTFANMGAFGLVTMLRRQDIIGDKIEDFRGLWRTNPLITAAMVIFLLSLAGIPATAGFVGKWWLFGAAIKADYAWLAVIAVLNTAISLYYYIRVAVAMCIESAEGRERVPVPVGVGLAVGLAAFFTLLIGLYPQPFIKLAQLAMLPLGATP